MAHIEDISGTGESLRAALHGMEEPELLAQQIIQQGAMHALETLLAHGCTEQVAQDMLASLRSNMLVIEAVAKENGFTRLFAETDDVPRVPSPAHQYQEAVLAIVGGLMHGDPAADSAEGKVLVKLADAVEAYERATLPPPLGNAGAPGTRDSLHTGAATPTAKPLMQVLSEMDDHLQGLMHYGHSHAFREAMVTVQETLDALQKSATAMGGISTILTDMALRMRDVHALLSQELQGEAGMLRWHADQARAAIAKATRAAA